MATEELPEILKEGTFVRITDSGYNRAKVVGYVGPFGPKGARIYRILVGKRPRPTYIEVLEEQLEVLDDGKAPVS